MKGLPFCCPAAPAWHVDWPALTEEFEWIRAMRDCPQDRVFHAEGTVWTHVGRYARLWQGSTSFVPCGNWTGISCSRPPCCTTWPSHRARGMKKAGSRRAGILSVVPLPPGASYGMGFNFTAREHVSALVRYHQLPFHLINRPDAQRLAFLISQTARCDLLTLLAKGCHGPRVRR